MSEAYSDLGPVTPPSTFSAPPTRPSPRITKIISELGLRYRPLASADQDAHAAQVALLVQDLAGVDPDKLTRAAQEYARTERFMPKACDLIALVNKQSEAALDLHALAARNNVSLKRDDVHWIVKNGRVELEWSHPPVGNLG